MRILQFLGRAFPPPLADGRFITRPWGRFGPSYAMTARQRTVRSKIHVALYVLLFTAIYLMPSLTARYDTTTVLIVAVALLYPFVGLLFSIGLPKVDEPPRRTPEQIRTAMSAYARAVGRSRLRLYLTVWCVLALSFGAIAVLVPEARFSGLWCFLVFALGAATTRELLVLASDGVLVDSH
jgi:Ca2+/Na+ antiporter